jgi:fructose-1,6-bisphosphatase/inositol monophosphatase family enzyme
MSLALCAVARGQLDGAAALDVDDYSTPASALVMQEAGVRVTSATGQPYFPGIKSLVAANPPLHAELLSLVQSA